MYLWIDLWDKRCWIAVYVEWVVIPKNIVPRVKIISEIKNILEEYNIKTIVVGLPYDLYWKEIKQLEKTKKFIEKLKSIFPEINIEWIDERFTSFEADNILSISSNSSFEWKKDAISASLILESYLTYLNNIKNNEIPRKN